MPSFSFDSTSFPLVRFGRQFVAGSALSTLVLLSGSCAQSQSEPTTAANPEPTSKPARIAAAPANKSAADSGPPEPTGVTAPASGWRAETVATADAHLWGIVWMPDGRAIATGKGGTLHVLENGSFREIPTEGMPDVFSGGQGGLMDIALHPKFAENKWIYMTVSTGTSRANRTTLIRGVFENNRVRDIQVLFQVSPDKSGGQHFGSRLLWLPDGTLLMSIGDGGNPPARVGDRLAREQAQNLATHQGKVLRLTADGKAAPGNPFLNREDAKPEIWSYGHRNIQGMARDPESGRIWSTEHGPRGGDELNLMRAGGNYGWPVASFGADYRTREPIGATSAEGMINPKVAWVPSPAPSGLVVYTGTQFPNWRGSIFSGGLAGQDIRRVDLDKNGNVTGENRLRTGVRIRDVRQGPDGHLYALTDEDNGRLLRIVPEG